MSAKDPARRYHSAQEVAEELSHFLRGESIRARPVSAPEKVWRWGKRKPVVAALGLSTILLLVAIAIGSPVAIYRIERACQLAQAREMAVREASYSTEMLFAAEEIEAENGGQAMELLNRSRPQGSQADLRGWEWRFLGAQCRSDEFFTGTERVRTVRFAADDRTLVIVTVRKLSLFRAPTFAEINAAEAGALKSRQMSAR